MHSTNLLLEEPIWMASILELSKTMSLPSLLFLFPSLCRSEPVWIWVAMSTDGEPLTRGQGLPTTRQATVGRWHVGRMYLRAHVVAAKW
jgi:hypothetical protein